MKKKEAISLLNKYKAAYYLASVALEPVNQQYLQRGARMQVMYKQLDRLQVPKKYLDEIDSWFDNDGVPRL